ncbi:MAG: TonB-dependent receptor [Rickettsiales bacterium]|jgi:iron complex outermembrane receptor protein|nr:TonB-dependent receptor [Rickettsiales bacterium]
MVFPASAQSTNPDEEFVDLSLEQLIRIKVTSVSKRSENANEAAAAIYVITQDDIRRSGMTSIPDLLRMVPGLSVAGSSAHQWAISSRGFSGVFSNKLLVLMDGRTVYTPLFSGVYWDAQDTMLEDIERIEVIRGPGATLWGTNAVNGVINIITKSSKDTVGGLAALTVGNQDKALARGRYGYKLDEDSYVRAYAKFDDRDESRTYTEARGLDAWNKGQAGFRADLGLDDKKSITIQGDMYRLGASGQLTIPSFTSPLTDSVRDRELAKGANLLARMNYEIEKDNDLTLQVYFDNAQRENAIFDDNRSTFDIDAQQALVAFNGQHEIVWGLGYRLVSDEILGSTTLVFSPQKRSDNLFSAFVQDKIALVPNEFFLTLGSKFEHNDYTGFEFQPSGRLSWIIDDRQTLWSSISRAVRSPNRFSDDGSLASLYNPDIDPGGPVVPAFVGTIGNRNLDSEVLNAYELGYRIQATDKISFDAATFYNDYDSLVIGALGAPTAVNFPGLGVVPYVPVTPQNLNEARAYGFELSSNWAVSSNFDVSAGYTYFDLKLDLNDPFGFEYAGKTPKHQFNIRSNWLLGNNVEWNNAAYFVDSLTGPTIPSYLRFDSRLAWRPVESLELSIVGQNLLDPYHPEFSGYTYQGNSQIPRSVYGNITWKF